MLTLTLQHAQPQAIQQTKHGDCGLSMNIRLFLILAFLPCVANSAVQSSITKDAITWTFDTDHTVGTYVNGDYWREDTYNSNNKVYSEDSEGSWEKWEYDSNNIL